MRKFLRVLLVVSDLACAQIVTSRMPSSRKILREGGTLHRLRKFLLAACAIAVGCPAVAQWLGADYAATGAQYSSFAASSFVNQSIINGSMLKDVQATRRSSNDRPPVAASITVADGVRSGATSRELAARYPAAQRTQIERAFNEAFIGYQKLEAQFGIPRNDVAGAVAAFIAGNYMAYRNADFPDKHFPLLVDQVRTVLASNPVFTRASAADKRQLYEQMAIIGTFMAVTNEAFKRNPNPESERNFRQTAQANLEQFLKSDADRLQISDLGMVIQ
ncbi:MAG: hypothetical protein JF606_09965 [Burkholderiales bacterium]|nr:hypothetical protein [Burkholderiales bacterium]